MNIPADGGAPVQASTASSAATVDVAKIAQPAAPATAPAPAAAAPAKAPEKGAWLADGKPAPAAAAAEPATPAAAATEAKQPEKLKVTVPEGFKMEAAALEAFEADMTALGVTSEQAQKLLAKNLETQKASHEALLSQLDKQDSDWLGELKTAWGEKFAENGEKLKRVYDYIDPQGDLRKGLEAMKLAHNPVLNKALAKLIPLFEEPKLKPPSAAGVPEKDTRTPMERLAAQFREDLKKPMQAPPGVMKFTT
jgi:hypothetical protein